MELIDFRRLLAETAAWCQKHASEADPAGSLRTPALLPTNRNAVADQWGYFDYRWGALAESQGGVSALGQRRAELLRVANDYPDNVPIGCADGRLLIAAPDGSDLSGLSEIESRGFIDALDVPAWDTWVCYVEEPYLPDAERMRKAQEAYHAQHGESHQGFVYWQLPASVSYLLCWVPPQFLGLVDAGILVNPVECFTWAVDYKKWCNTRFLQQLDAAGLLK